MRIALVKNNTVMNVLQGENIEDVALLFPKDSAVIETEETGIAWNGAKWNGTRFQPIQIYPSWTWNEETYSYNSPVEKPEGDYYWNEGELAWLPIPIPTDPETGLEILEAEAE